MATPYVVVCQYDKPYDTYGLFLHEADLLLLELGQAVSKGEMTAEQAKEIWKPYRDFYPELYQAGYEERYEEAFPTEEEMDFLPATHQFEEEVQRLEIAGAGYVSPSSGSGSFVTIQGEEALEAVREQLRERYRIVVLDGSEPEEYWKGGPEGMLRVIAWARERAGLGG